MDSVNTYTVFEGQKLFAQGYLTQVVLKIKKKSDKNAAASFTIFSDQTGKTMDFNLRGTEDEVLRRLEVFTQDSHSASGAAGPGRPKLGVVSREVSLLPQQWEWLATQPSGASATIRKLVEDAKKKSSGTEDVKSIQERVYKFMSVLAGDLRGYEEALRALYRKDKRLFHEQIKTWPEDIRDHLAEIAKPVFQI